MIHSFFSVLSVGLLWRRFFNTVYAANCYLCKVIFAYKQGNICLTFELVVSRTKEAKKKADLLKSETSGHCERTISFYYLFKMYQQSNSDL